MLTAEVRKVLNEALYILPVKSLIAIPLNKGVGKKIFRSWGAMKISRPRK